LGQQVDALAIASAAAAAVAGDKPPHIKIYHVLKTYQLNV